MKFLNWSFKLFRIANIDVRVHTFLVLYVLFELMRWGKVGMALYGAELMLALLLITLLHEFGHCFMARALRLQANEILLWPLGGLAMVGQSRNHKDNILVAFAGPTANIAIAFVLLAVMLVLHQPINAALFSLTPSYGTSIVRDIFNMNYIITLFNLFLPVYPLDGGRIFHGFLAGVFKESRAATITAGLGITGGAVLAGFGIFNSSLFTLGIGLSFVVQAAKMLESAKHIRERKLDAWDELCMDVKQTKLEMDKEKREKVDQKVEDIFDNLKKGQFKG